MGESDVYGLTSQDAIVAPPQALTMQLGQSESPGVAEAEQPAVVLRTTDETARRLDWNEDHREAAHDSLGASGADNQEDRAMPRQVAEDKQQPSSGAYAFLDQDDEVEIKIEPIQNYLKFSNIGGVNSGEYQEAIQMMDTDYFGRSQPLETADDDVLGAA